MLLRERRSRIYYLRQFFDYPISLSVDTLIKLGPVRTLRIGLSYARSMLFPGGKQPGAETGPARSARRAVAGALRSSP